MTGTTRRNHTTSATDTVSAQDFFLPLHNADGIIAFTTTRGGESPDDPYGRFSLCHYTGDTAGHVATCRRALADRLSISPERLIVPRQTHSSNVAIITGDMPLPTLLEETDAVVTDVPQLAIGVNTADCVPLLLFDPAARVIAAVHAGWRGTVARIAAKAVAATSSLGATPRHIRVIIGPCICPDCFEVGYEVVEQFAEAGFPVADIASRHPGTGKQHIDLREANHIVLVDSGILAENIAPAVGCSRCNPDRYFSARRLGIASGRTFTGVMME